MHGLAATPDNINAIPEAAIAMTSDNTAHKVDLRTSHPTSASSSPTAAPHDTTLADSTTNAAHNVAEVAHTTHKPGQDTNTTSKQSTVLGTIPHPRSTAVLSEHTTFRGPRRRWSGNWLHYAVANREKGMSTAEYAVGTIAACAFAALLFKVVSSPEVQEMLTSLIDRALKTNSE